MLPVPAGGYCPSDIDRVGLVVSPHDVEGARFPGHPGVLKHGVVKVIHIQHPPVDRPLDLPRLEFQDEIVVDR